MGHNLKIKKYIQTLEALSQSTDDYLFVWDIQNDRNWFFGDIDKDFAIRREGSIENSVEDMYAITHPNDIALLREDLEAVVYGGKLVHDLNYRWINRNGKPVWVSCRGNVIQDDDGTPMVLIGRVSRALFENKVNRITGMFNKRKMLEDSQAQQFMTKDGYVLFLGLDKLLKSYSQYGRKHMESIIENCARILEEMTGSNRYLYHAEDSIFVVCFKDAIAEDIQSFYAELIKKLNKQCTITAVALPSNKQYFTDERELYDAAIEELIKAKKSRRAKLSFFSKKSVVEQINERLLEEKIEQAVNNNFEGFYICYQPQIRGTDYTLDGVEALMRFRSEGVEYSPSKFIPILEQLGLIHNAGIWVLKTALAQLAIWREKLPDLRLNVNFSLGQFSDPDAIETVIKIYKESLLPAHVLTVELTETVQVEDIDQIVIATRTWQAAGIDVALDDFGKGYSNLVMLKEIACNEIKIERAFISRIKEGTYSYLLASSIINFAHQNGVCVCCEGVETENDVATLSPLKPDLFQGYAFDKPCTPEEFESYYIKRYSSAYRRRKRLAQHLRELAEDRITSFDPNEILTNIGVGLSVMMWDIKAKSYEIHPDSITANLLGMPSGLTPLECNDFWFKRIKDGYQHYVRRNLRKLNTDTEVVQFMYPWIHPQQGELILSFSGVRSESKNGKTVVKGLHRVVSMVEKIGFDETTRPLKYFIQNRYMDIILDKAIAFMEINVTKNKVEGGFRDLIGNQPNLGEDYMKMTNASGDLMYNEFESWWAGKYLIKCDKDFRKISNCTYLQTAFERGERNVEMNCKCLDRDGSIYDCKKSIFITRDEFKGDIMALCVIYDVSEELKEKADFLHRDATIRSLSDDYKSIMYINVDEDTVAFYREDLTLEEWKKDVDQHSVMMTVFAERFVHEEDRAEYKYLLSPITMKEMLTKDDEYRFEYRRKCKNTYRYHEVKIKRDESSEEGLCAIMGVKDIEEDVQLRLQLKETLELAYTDHLTGLYNQQGLFARCTEVLEDKNVNSAVLFMDLDNFKLVNDMYGHGMGDKVLYEVGKAIKEETRGKDIVGRYGGDEFVVLIYDIKHPAVAEDAAERIAARINDVCGQLKLHVDVSASIGIAFTNQTGHDYLYLKEIADDRLYLAKKRGKNQIVKNV